MRGSQVAALTLAFAAASASGAALGQSTPSLPAASEPAPAAASAPAALTPEGQWKHDADQRAEELTRRWGTGTDAALRDQVLGLQQQDQQARGLVPGPDGQVTRAKDLREVDQQLSAQLRSLIEVHGWPTVALVGLPASNAAMLVLNHSPDHVWQRALLPLLEELADAGKIDAAMLAVVVDKELVSEGKLQRYGTQFRSVGASMRMYAVEDPATLDSRRAHLLLPPMSVYKAMLTQMYGMPVTEGLVSATAGTPGRQP